MLSMPGDLNNNNKDEGNMNDEFPTFSIFSLPIPGIENNNNTEGNKSENFPIFPIFSKTSD